MANAALLAGKTPARILLVGTPGSGKTGSLAALVNAGFKMRFIDLDGNTQPLILFTDPDKLPLLDIVSLSDPLKAGAKVMEPAVPPSAYAKAVGLLDDWTDIGPDGKPYSLGKSRDWGPDTIVVLDSLTSLGRASMRRVLHMANRTSANMTDGNWGTAMSEQEAFVEKLVSSRNGFHVIVLSHTKMVGPDAIRAKEDDDLTKKIKEEKGTLIETRLYPSALGKQLPWNIGGHFTTLLEARREYLPGNRVNRVLTHKSRPELDLKIPDLKIADDLPISTGMVTVFDAITPGVKACLAWKPPATPEAPVPATAKEKV